MSQPLSPVMPLMPTQPSASASSLRLKSDMLGAAEAFYSIFRALPRDERFAIADYIFADEEIQLNIGLLELPNETTKQAFREPKEKMATFETINDLRKDLLS